MKRIIIALLLCSLSYSYGDSVNNENFDEKIVEAIALLPVGISKPKIKHSSRHVDQPKKIVKYVSNAMLEEVTLFVKEDEKSDATIERKGILTIRPHARATIICCHGYMSNKRDMRLLSYVLGDCYNLFTFDLRGHGECHDGQCCTLGHNEKFDVESAVEFIKSHPALKNKPLILYGFSMGAVAAARAQSANPGLCDGLILDCPFDSTDNLIERGLEQMKFNIFGIEVGLPGSSILKSYAYTPYVQTMIKYFFKAIANLDATQVNTCILHPVNTVDDMKKIQIPVFMIGCIKDDKVPLKALLEVYNAAGSTNKKLLITDGERHFGSIFHDPERYQAEVMSWLNKCVQGRLKKEARNKIRYDDATWAHKLT